MAEYPGMDDWLDGWIDRSMFDEHDFYDRFAL